MSRVFHSLIITLFTAAITVSAPSEAQAQSQRLKEMRGQDAATINNLKHGELRRRPWRSDHGLIEVERLLIAEEYTEALRLIDVIKERNLRLGDLHAYEAHAHLALGNFEQAQAALRMIARVNPRHFGGRYYAGKLALLRGDIEKARDEMEAIKSLCIAGECLEYKALREQILKYNKNRSEESRSRGGRMDSGRYRN